MKHDPVDLVPLPELLGSAEAAAFAAQLNAWGQAGTPFLCMVDFEGQKPIAWPLQALDNETLLFALNGATNVRTAPGIQPSPATAIVKTPITPEQYAHKFQKVYQRLAYGDSFLTNLTINTDLQLTHTLKELFFLSTARYKLWYKNAFLVFSPETFVQMHNGHIYAYPMKGTIDAAIPQAEARILNDQKELAEHVTIVDLIRNDLSQVAREVAVKKFRYIDRIVTHDKMLLQVSSEIVGKLPAGYQSQLGTILMSLLPAGSVSGAPKPSTLKIIRDAEGADRGYYTGIVGYFDGEKFDSGVMIRFIEQRNNRYIYRSGGGITTQSHLQTEYQEAIDKVYVPIN